MKHILKVIRNLILISIFIVAIAAVLMNIRQPYNDTLVVEAGDKIFSAAYFFKNLDDGAEYVTPEDEIELNHVGVNHIKIKLKGLVYNVKLEVVDTTPPKATVKEKLDSFVGVDVLPEAFIEEFSDATDVKISYIKRPDFMAEGIQDVTIKITDEGNNSVTFESQISIVKDDVPPQIFGVYNRQIPLNGTVMYRDSVYVADNQDGVILEVDSSQVDITKEGTYPVVYKATDMALNETVVVAEFTVVKSEEALASSEVIDEYFQGVYDKIITEDMTKREKARAIFDYVLNGISYSPVEDRTDWEQAAYRGLQTRKGDCYTTYAVSRKLLEMAEIENMCIYRAPSEKYNISSHYWNLINCGDGWYHFDACKLNVSDSEVFMWTDKQVAEFSAEYYPGYFEFDATKYPATP